MSEVDGQGRNVIDAQDFVKEYGVRTVFGFGGTYLGAVGTFVTPIFFYRETLEQSTVERLQMMVNAFKPATADQMAQGRVFVN